jgi:hypothetical protein
MYEAKGFTVSTVTLDDEPSIVTLKQVLLQNNITLNVLGRGSHAHHAESAVCHVQNEERSTAHSLPYTLPEVGLTFRVKCTAGYAPSSVPRSGRVENRGIQRDAHLIRGRER